VASVSALDTGTLDKVSAGTVTNCNQTRVVFSCNLTRVADILRRYFGLVKDKMPADIQCRVSIPMAYLRSATLPTLYGRLYITKGSTFHTNLAVFLLHLPLIKLSRFANLETLPFPPLTLGHTMPAIPYTSGKYSLPSGTGAGPVRPSRVGSVV